MNGSQEFASGADEGFQDTLLMGLNHQKWCVKHDHLRSSNNALFEERRN